MTQSNPTIQHATQQQNKAASPQKSVWVSANAGTGKTRVLTQRILRFLVETPPVDPQHILALTFSKAGAQEMLERLRETLAHWQIQPEGELLDILSSLLNRAPQEEEITRARTLYHLVLDTPPHIVTIHSFCYQLLSKFPLEAGLMPQFKVLEGREADYTLEQALQAALADFIDTTHTAFNAFSFLATHVGEESLKSVLKQTLIGQRGRLKTFISQQGGIKAYATTLSQHLGLNTLTFPEHFEAYQKALLQLVPPASVQNQWRTYLPALENGKTKTQAMGATVASYISKTDAAQELEVLTYAYALLTQKQTPPKGVPDKAFAEQHPDFVDFLAAEQARLISIFTTHKSLLTYLHTIALLTVSQHVLQHYAALKHKQAAVDFDDLIEKSLTLLKNSDVQEWVRYKLDRSLEHVLLDEGQDTNPAQWEILQALTGEFFAGDGQHITPRTLFAVGDMKQSIYRFQGAEPTVFGDIWTYLTEYAPEAEREQINMQASFRSSPAILNVTDQVLQPFAAQLTHGLGDVQHQAAFDLKGAVELWPLMEGDALEEREAWSIPTLTPPARNAAWYVADAIAKKIHQLISSHTTLPCTGRPVDYGDIMILLRSRTSQSILVERLQHYHIPLFIGGELPDGAEHPIIEDLTAIGAFLLNPDDDIACAHTLKSPLFRVADAELLALEGTGSLWHRLQQANHPCVDTLHVWLNWAQNMSPYALYQHILQSSHGVGKLCSAFMPTPSNAVRQALQHVIETFLNEALSNGESLAYFITRVQQEGLSIPAQPVADTAGAVRILTVHGSKGLEAPIVFLPDTTKDMTAGTHQESFLWEQNEHGQDTIFLSKRPTAEQTDIAAAILEGEQERIFQDELRLLYVALTRAKGQLHVAGALPRRSKNAPEKSWYSLIQQAAETHNWHAEDDILVYTAGTEMLDVAAASASQKTEHPLPIWVNTEVALSQQSALRASSSEKVDGQTGINARQRGIWLHKAFELLPNIPLEMRRDVLSTSLPDAPEELRTMALDMFTALEKTDPWLFTENTFAEVAVPLLHTKGVIDRLIMADEKITIVDFKTDLDIPPAGEKMPTHYAQQLRTYQQAMQAVYPDIPIQTALVWMHHKNETGCYQPRIDLVDT